MTAQPDAASVERRRRVETSQPMPVAQPGQRDATTMLERRMAHYLVPGCSVAVIDGGRIAWTRGYGVVEAGQAAVTPDTIFQACSISKPVAAVAALRLVQEGRLDLDADINTTLTSWRVPANGAWQPRVTLRHLLTHGAGLTYCWYPGYARGVPTPTLVQTLEGEPPANTPPVRVVAIPGTQFRYSGSHFSVLQQLLVDVTGRPFPELMRELVFDPLGMRHSSYDQSFPETHGGAAAAGHDAAGVPLAGRWHVQPELAGAGLWTTPADLARLALEVQAAWGGGASRVLGRDIARRMLAPHLADRGLGWALEGPPDRPRFSHGGDNIGYKCHLTADAARGIGAVVMTNGDEGRQIVDGVLRAVAAEYRWPDPVTGEERPPAPPDAPDPAPPRIDPAYAGEYRLDSGLAFTVTVERDALALQAAAQPAIPLRPVADTAFVADAVDAALDFERAADGAVIGFTLRQRGDEVFARKTA